MVVGGATLAGPSAWACSSLTAWLLASLQRSQPRMNKRDRGDDDGGAGEGGGGDVAVPADKRARTAPSTALVAVDTSQALIVAATNPVRRAAVARATTTSFSASASSSGGEHAACRGGLTEASRCRDVLVAVAAFVACRARGGRALRRLRCSSLATGYVRVCILGARLSRRRLTVLVAVVLVQGFVQALEFDPTGRHIASGSRDKRIFLWNVYGDCENYAVLEGHKNAVIDLHWSIDGRCVSVSVVVCLWLCLWLFL